MSIGNFPEIVSQRILAGTYLSRETGRVAGGGEGASAVRSARAAPRLPAGAGSACGRVSRGGDPTGGPPPNSRGGGLPRSTGSLLEI